MPQFKHDRFVKFYLKELYDRIKGRVTSNIEVTAHETLSLAKPTVGNRPLVSC